MSLEQRICSICGKAFYAASEHRLTDTRGKLVCSCHCSTVAYDRRYCKKERKQRRKEAKGKREPHNMKPVLMLKNEDGSILGRFPSVKAASEAAGISTTTISHLCNGKSKPRGDYTFIFENQKGKEK